MKRQIKFTALVFLAWMLLSSWGYSGHEKISRGAVLYYNDAMRPLAVWTDSIAIHSGDPDKRKKADKTEGHKHYIDIDLYPEYVRNGSINPNFDSLVTVYGADFVNEQGILPWATIATYDSLVACLQRKDFNKAVLFAADLSHYVADGHMPLHISSNYDGKETGNDGIHRRYESQMINQYLEEIHFIENQVQEVDDLQSYVFTYLYHSGSYVDSIFQADNYAKSINPDLTSDEYFRALWDKTNGYTDQFFSDAALSFASILYTAWISAGSPAIQ